MLSSKRIGKITSSQIYRLMLKGRGSNVSARTLDYLEEVRMERLLQRELNSVTSSRPIVWGHALEPRVASLLGEFEYQYVSDKTIVHPTITDWAGTPDLIGTDKVGDIKCPYTLKSFVQLVESMNKGTIKQTHPEYYWQLVSNAILTEKTQAELIVYCPYREELDEIRDSLENLDDTDLQTEAQWISFSRDELLPYIHKGGYFQNLNRALMAIPPSDREELIQKVKWAAQQLQ